MGVKEDLKTFIIQYGVFAYVAGMVIALTVKDLIESFIGDLLIPGITLFLIHLQLGHLSKYLPGKNKVNGLQLAKTFLTFILTFFILYLSFVTIIQPFMN
jgi:large-conductance mechanosensitive channel